MDLKKEAAAKAVSMIKDKSIVGLGAGRTIAHAIEFLKKNIENGLNIQVVTSSFTTNQLLLKNKLPVLQLSSLNKIDIYFDGCDQVDKKLNALKSGGGIHTHEKLLASMSDEFILMGDETKLVDNLDSRFPLVIEILPEAEVFAATKIQMLFQGVKAEFRINDKREGPVLTENGNYLLDIWFDKWPDLAIINPVLKTITGVVETSLFYMMANKAIIANAKEVEVLERS
ncbi:ribose 5-phosphate isomerase A [Segetibacter koreensis]|uniref:ribose 5-phosphate isomerase A n=1 Tax=Segetibacter koreensis TaxID=398037 RepID=UPI00035F656F|nr:ribose 5-phosphate isomerase A [Segetibacter koreensis]